DLFAAERGYFLPLPGLPWSLAGSRTGGATDCCSALVCVAPATGPFAGLSVGAAADAPPIGCGSAGGVGLTDALGAGPVGETVARAVVGATVGAAAVALVVVLIRTASRRMARSANGPVTVTLAGPLGASPGSTAVSQAALTQVTDAAAWPLISTPSLRVKPWP